MMLRSLFILLGLALSFLTTKAQSQYSFTPGAYYNGALLREYVGGFGAVLGLEYMPHPKHFFALELRTRYGCYSFDDGTKWKENDDGSREPPIRNKARLEYTLFSPQIGIVPKLYHHFDNELSFFIDNEFACGLMMGRFHYAGTPSVRKNFTEPIFYYSISGGVELRNDKDWSLLLSVGYSTLNFKSKIEKNQPLGYKGVFPDQNAGVLINVIFKIPLN